MNRSRHQLAPGIDRLCWSCLRQPILDVVTGGQPVKVCARCLLLALDELLADLPGALDETPDS